MARPLTLDLWSVAHERMTTHQVVTRSRAHHARITAIARSLKDSSRS